MVLRRRCIFGRVLADYADKMHAVEQPFPVFNAGIELTAGLKENWMPVVKAYHAAELKIVRDESVSKD